MTGGRYKNGFQGCVLTFETDHGATNLHDVAVSAVNVDVCPE